MVPSPTPEDVLTQIDQAAYDRELVPQERLDLANKMRTSLFPWRGQFSPELIEIFLEMFAKNGDVVLDPFVGSGTVLFESARRGLECYAAEINPSAVVMASTAHFINVRPMDRVSYIDAARSLVEPLATARHPHLFSVPVDNTLVTHIPIEDSVATLTREATDPLTRNILANTLMRFMNVKGKRSPEDMLLALDEIAEIARRLPYSDNPVRVFHTDARTIPLEQGSVDLVITSPPYINVFNYHQNNRPAMELIGWDLLSIAKSELGSNRKNRQNRFLTVVQYCLDMLSILKETRRLLKHKGRAIFVVGRTSNVRGINFKNGRIVAALATGGAGFVLDRMQERAFTNRFGERIFEDILHLLPDSTAPMQDDTFARRLGQVVLAEGAQFAGGEIAEQILASREQAPYIKESPVFELPRDSNPYQSL